MSINFDAYVNPGIYIEEINFPLTVSPSIAPTIIGLVGTGQGYQSYTQTILVPADTGGSGTAVALTKLGINTSSIVIVDRWTGQGYNGAAAFIVGTDYTVTTSTSAPGSVQYPVTSITRITTGNISVAEYLTISYTFTDATYGTVQSFTDYQDVVGAYGNPFDTTGTTINSSVTLAAYLAFLNGAQTIYVSPVTAASPTAANYVSAVNAFGTYPEVNVVVPLSDLTGTPGVYQGTLQYLTQMQGQGTYVIAFVGRSLGSAGTYTDLISQAQGIDNSRVAIVFPSQINILNGSNTITVDGWYAAAAVAGVLGGQAPQIPLTHKKVKGFSGIPQQVLPTSQQEFNMQQSGVMVLHKNRDGSIQVNHGLSTNPTNIYTREFNIQFAQDRLQDLLVSVLNQSALIGGVLDATTPNLVMSIVTGALNYAESQDLIYSYANTKWRVPSFNPTLMQVQFSYKPMLPLNYIQIQFAVDTTAGSIDFTNASTTTSSG